MSVSLEQKENLFFVHQLGTTDCWPLTFGRRLLIPFECRDCHTMCLIVAFLWLASDSFCVERVLSLSGTWHWAYWRVWTTVVEAGAKWQGRFARLLGIRWQQTSRVSSREPESETMTAPRISLFILEAASVFLDTILALAQISPGPAGTAVSTTFRFSVGEARQHQLP